MLGALYTVLKMTDCRPPHHSHPDSVHGADSHDHQTLMHIFVCGTEKVTSSLWSVIVLSVVLKKLRSIPQLSVRGVKKQIQHARFLNLLALSCLFGISFCLVGTEHHCWQCHSQTVFVLVSQAQCASEKKSSSEVSEDSQRL